MKTALIAGATGLVGGHCLRALLAGGRYARVIALARRPLGLADARLELRSTPLQSLTAADCAGAHDVFCALGTTMKAAGDRERFRHVDCELVAKLAHAAHAGGASQFVLVSSAGASLQSRNFYARVKAEAEQAVAAVPYRAVHIFRPSLLLGKRQESRPLEAFGQLLMPLLNPMMVGALHPFRAVDAAAVARAMVVAANSGTATGVRFYFYDEIIRMSRELCGSSYK